MIKHLFSAAFAMALGLALTACTSNDSQDHKSTTSADMSSTSKVDMKSDMATAPKKATLGMLAPDFTLTDMNGKSVKLSDYRGKTVVLEWFNPGCPFVVYAYGQGPLKDMPANLMKNDIVWLTINSGAPGMQGAGMDTNKKAVDDWSMKSKVLFDESGSVGKMYDAKTTPHCYVIDKKGTLVYRGALDNAPNGKTKDGAYQNYVQMAIDDIAAGRTVRTQEMAPYGCSVKYAK